MYSCFYYTIRIISWCSVSRGGVVAPCGDGIDDGIFLYIGGGKVGEA